MKIFACLILLSALQSHRSGDVGRPQQRGLLVAYLVHVCSSTHTSHFTLRPSGCLPCDRSHSWPRCWSCCHRGPLCTWPHLPLLSCSPHHCGHPWTPAWHGTEGREVRKVRLPEPPPEQSPQSGPLPGDTWLHSCSGASPEFRLSLYSI